MLGDWFLVIVLKLEIELEVLKCVNGGSNVLQVEFPVFQDLPQLPAPFGTLYHTQVYLA